MKNRYYVTSNMLRNRGACDGARERFRELFGVGHNDEVELTNPDNVRTLMRSSHFSWRLDWPAARLFSITGFRTKLERAAASVRDKLNAIGERTDRLGVLDERDVERVVELYRRTGQLWDRWKAGER